MDLFNPLSTFSDGELLAECERRNLIPSHLPATRTSAISIFGFEDFWQMYPRKVGKREAAKAWARLSVDQRRTAIATIEGHTWMWVQEGRGTAMIPHASTWLNAWRFDDEIGYVAPRGDSPVRESAHTRSADVLRNLEGS